MGLIKKPLVDHKIEHKKLQLQLISQMMSVASSCKNAAKKVLKVKSATTNTLEFVSNGKEMEVTEEDARKKTVASFILNSAISP